ncbi:MAG: salicylate hydroxylase, partial [Pseudorhodoplanes sp.]
MEELQVPSIAIVGGGIGGLATALSLIAAGFDDLQVLEAADELRPLGVGINLPPHAVRELTELGLGDRLKKIAVETSTLSYYDRRGNLIWAEPRGLRAGYSWPQYSVHRGLL